MGQAEWASRVAGGADLQDANFGGSEDLTMGQFFTRSNPSKEDSKQKSTLLVSMTVTATPRGGKTVRQCRFDSQLPPSNSL